MKLQQKFPRAWALMESVRAKRFELDTLREHARELRERAQRTMHFFGPRTNGGTCDREGLLARALDAERRASAVEEALKARTLRAEAILERMPLPIEAAVLRLIFVDCVDKGAVCAALRLTRPALQCRLERGMALAEELAGEDVHGRTA